MKIRIRMEAQDQAESRILRLLPASHEKSECNQANRCTGNLASVSSWMNCASKAVPFEFSHAICEINQNLNLSENRGLIDIRVKTGETNVLVTVCHYV